MHTHEKCFFNFFIVERHLQSHYFYYILTNIYLNLSPGSLCQSDIEERLAIQNNNETWTTKDGYKPFPAPLKKKTTSVTPSSAE